MYDVWIATENNGRFKPVTRVPQEHKTVEEAFLCAGRMVKLLGAEFLTAKNCNVFGVHPTNCIAVYDPHTETAVGEPSAALIAWGPANGDRRQRPIHRCAIGVA